jgi:flagellar hook-associated protein 2
LSSAGIAVSVSADTNGYLNIVSNRYGSASIVTGSGSAAVDLFGTVTSADGKNVVGTIDGVEATGSGQTLTGMKGSSSEGLQILINGGAIGDRGTLKVMPIY